MYFWCNFGDISAHEWAQKLMQDFCRESILWKGLDHIHVLPFFGVSNEAFQGSVCMVLPWQEHGNVKQYISTLREKPEFSALAFVVQLNEWVCFVLIELRTL